MLVVELIKLYFGKRVEFAVSVGHLFLSGLHRFGTHGSGTTPQFRSKVALLSVFHDPVDTQSMVRYDNTLRETSKHAQAPRSHFDQRIFEHLTD